MIAAKVSVGEIEVLICPGDTLELGDEGLIVFLTTEKAKIYDMLRAEQAREVRRAIRFTEERMRNAKIQDT